ncbi:MAG: GNAT family N-acetyltransferase [Candidatus Hydromicrobium sp.]
MKILQAKTQDMIQKAYKLRFEVFVEEQNVPPELESDEYDKTATHVLAIDERSGDCIGCGRLVIKNETAKIGRIAIKKSYRRKGYGKKICLKLIDIAQKVNVKDITLDAQLQVVGFYKKLGFKEYGNIFIEADIKHIAMKLSKFK